MEKPKMPATVYVQWYKDRNDGLPKSQGTYLVAKENAETAADDDTGAFKSGERVGVYRLERVVRLESKTTVTEHKAK